MAFTEYLFLGNPDSIFFKCFYYSFRYIVGPLPKVVCQINYFMKLHFTIHSLILLDFIAVTRD